MTVIYSIPHVTLLSADDDMLLLKVEDMELFDTFDDIFTEQFDIGDYTHATEFVNGLAVYTIYFPKGVDKNRLLEAVKSIDEAEVERIFKINNPD